MTPRQADLPELNPNSPACQRWGHGRHSWVHRSAGGFDPASYTVEPLDEPAAKDFVVAHHYSHAFPAAARRYGLWDHRLGAPVLVGVAVFSIPAHARVLTNVFPHLAPYTESLELGRFVLLGDPAKAGDAAVLPQGVPAPSANAESWFLARCFELLAAAGIRGIVSFADPVPRRVGVRLLYPGHAGIVYQAMGAAYLNRATPRTLTLLPDGTVLSDRALQKIRTQEQGHDYVERQLRAFGAGPLLPGTDPARWLVDALADARVTRLRHRGNLRYAMATTRKDRAWLRAAVPGLPYRKQPDLG